MLIQNVPNKYAALFGVTQWKNHSAPSLVGPVHDIEKLADYLVAKHAFLPGNIKQALNEQASKELIFNGLWDLTKIAKAGDEVVFLWTGHGDSITDFTGTEADGRSECIVPWDYDGTKGSLATDKELANIINNFETGVNFTALLASCYSGDGTKALSSRLPKSAPEFLHIDGELNHLAISACRSNQTSSDASFGILDPEHNDAALYCIIETLKKNPGVPWGQIMQLSNKMIQEEGFEQVAQIYGPTSRINGYPFGGI